MSKLVMNFASLRTSTSSNPRTSDDRERKGQPLDCATDRYVASSLRYTHDKAQKTDALVCARDLGVIIPRYLHRLADVAERVNTRTSYLFVFTIHNDIQLNTRTEKYLHVS